MLSLHQRYRQRQTDRQTDEQTTYDSNTALALRASRGKKISHKVLNNRGNILVRLRAEN